MKTKIIFGTGGTGGHIFPAIALADFLTKKHPNLEVIFVGAKGGMEEKLVKRAGYKLYTLPIQGLYRKINLKNIIRNLKFPFKLLKSQSQAKKILKTEQPKFVIGFGGFASAPIVKTAVKKGFPVFLNEQNAYPGLVNRLIDEKAEAIFLGNKYAKKYLKNKNKIVSGNPIRPNLLEVQVEKKHAEFDLDLSKKTILVLGGSLGARSINNAISEHLDSIQNTDIQILWQCGKLYFEELKTQTKDAKNISLMPFIQDMSAAYHLADLVISRAGASTISELIQLSKVSILVPSPNVAEDHQTKNAQSLMEDSAAVLIKDADAKLQLLPSALELLNDEEKLSKLSSKIQALEKPKTLEIIGNYLENYL